MPAPRIVVVDDDPVIRMTMQHWLASAGYLPAVFGDGAEALAAVRVAPPDLIILDHVMAPVDGLALHANLQADSRLRSIPILFLTGAPQDVPPLPGVAAVIGKPFQLERLEALLRGLLGSRPAR